MTRVSIAKGVTAASLAAGPLFLATLSLAGRIGRGAADIRAVDLGTIAGIVLIATIVGAPVALLPNLIGAKLLGEVGWQNAGTRMLPFWALVGSGGGALLGYAVGGQDAGPVMAAVGAGCALVCRWGTRWAD